MLKMTGDFETTTDPNDVRIWSFGLVNIDTFEVMKLGTSIDEMIEYLSNKNSQVYFHNLKFDGEFIIPWLFNNGYTYSETKESKTFHTIISDTGQFYGIEIIFKKMKRKYKKVMIFDSLKKLPFTVDAIGKMMGHNILKMDIDYDKPRPLGYEPTPHEWNYLVTDCMIVAKALASQFEMGLTRMTIGADAMAGVIAKIGGKDRFRQIFPALDLETDKEIRYSYKGGFVWLNPKYKGTRQPCVTFDINSQYPDKMRNELMPYGYPMYYEGEYVEDDFFPLYIQHLRCEFKLKKDHIPTIQLKGNNSFVQTEYLKDSGGEIVELHLTSVDLKLFLDHYEVYCLEYIDGYMFKACKGLFDEYIDYWMSVKENSTGSTRLHAKLMINNPYGKFATNPKMVSKIPYLKEGILRYYEDEPEYKEPIYTAVASFITSYGREQTIRTLQNDYERAIYGDTDSASFAGTDMPDIDIHPTKLGYWDHEGTYEDSKFLRAKTYMKTLDGEIEIKCAGMPMNVKKTVQGYDDFEIGSEYFGKLKPKKYNGGVILEAGPYKIRK